MFTAAAAAAAVAAAAAGGCGPRRLTSCGQRQRTIRAGRWGRGKWTWGGRTGGGGGDQEGGEGVTYGDTCVCMGQRVAGQQKVEDRGKEERGGRKWTAHAGSGEGG